MLNLDAMNFTREDIITIDNFLELEDFNKTLDFLARPKWGWGHGSNPNNPEYSTPFWKMELTEEQFFHDYIFNLIKKTTNEEYFLTRCYANGHTYGSCGSFHTDWDDDSGRTALLYANDSWMQEWGGKTVFLVNGQCHYIECIPNTLVIFPAIIPHRAEGTSRFFNGLRKTIAWKLTSVHPT